MAVGIKMNRLVSWAMVVTLLMNVFALAFFAQPAGATGTIYIRPNGSVDPPTAPIQRNGDVYTLTGNVTSDSTGINIQRGNIILDGAGYTLHGPGDCKGIFLS